MSLHLRVNPKTEARLLEIARRGGIEPAVLIEKMVEKHKSRTLRLCSPTGGTARAHSRRVRTQIVTSIN
jgi:hypothetical protein